MNYAKKHGFTLIEIMIVIAILSILSTVILSSLQSAREKAQMTKLLSEMIEVRKAIALYRSQNSGNWPVFIYEGVANEDRDWGVGMSDLLEELNGAGVYPTTNIVLPPMYGDADLDNVMGVLAGGLSQTLDGPGHLSCGNSNFENVSYGLVILRPSAFRNMFPDLYLGGNVIDTWSCIELY